MLNLSCKVYTLFNLIEVLKQVLNLCFDTTVHVSSTYCFHKGSWMSNVIKARSSASSLARLDTDTGNPIAVPKVCRNTPPWICVKYSVNFTFPNNFVSFGNIINSPWIRWFFWVQLNIVEQGKHTEAAVHELHSPLISLCQNQKRWDMNCIASLILYTTANQCLCSPVFLLFNLTTYKVDKIAHK